MADDVKTSDEIHIGFVSGSAPTDDVRLLGVVGRERLSRLFEFDLLFIRPESRYSDDELDKLLKSPCAIALGPKPGDVVHGILSTIDVLDATRKSPPHYVARLVPKAWLLTQNRSSRIFQDTNVPDMVATIL